MRQLPTEIWPILRAPLPITSSTSRQSETKLLFYDKGPKAWRMVTEEIAINIARASAEAAKQSS
jgi:hypothetical protein